MVEYTKILYTSNAVFTVPQGVTRVRVSLCGGGASAGDDHYYPAKHGAGGHTTFGKYLTARGANSQAGLGYFGERVWLPTTNNGKGGAIYSGNVGGIYGGNGNTGYGGGSGQYLVYQYVYVTPGELIPITIGAGGVGGASYIPSGTKGSLMLEYGGEIELTSDLPNNLPTFSKFIIPHQSVLITDNSQFTPPEGITHIKVSLCGGGGSGNIDFVDTVGGETLFGGIVAKGGHSITSDNPTIGGIGGGCTISDIPHGMKLYTQPPRISYTGMYGTGYGAGSPGVGYAFTGIVLGGDGGSYGGCGCDGFERTYTKNGLYESEEVDKCSTGGGGSGEYIVNQMIDVSTIQTPVECVIGRGVGGGVDGAILIEYGGDIQPGNETLADYRGIHAFEPNNFCTTITDLTKGFTIPSLPGAQEPLTKIQQVTFKQIADAINVLETLYSNNCHCAKNTTKCQSCQSCQHCHCNCDCSSGDSDSPGGG